MKNVRLLFLLFIFFAGFAAAQSQPVLYLCEKYGNNGEVGISDRFTKGYLTVMVKSDEALGLTECAIQFDKWDPYSAKFKYYKKFNYTIEPDMSYVYFNRNSESDLSFDEVGFFRVYLLDEDGNTVASNLVQIID